MDFSLLDRERMIRPVPGFAPPVGVLMDCLNMARLKTMRTVAHLTVAQLDHHQDEHANSIGTLLLHMAAVEFAVGQMTFHGQPDPVPLGAWQNPLDMGEWARRELKGHPVDYYFEKMAAVRAATMENLRRVNERWLWQETTWRQGIKTNHYYLWFHVYEDEIGHRGEINWLISRLPDA